MQRNKLCKLFCVAASILLAGAVSGFAVDIAGTSTGSFSNPTLESMGVTSITDAGGGHNNLFTWGRSDPSSLEFSGAAFAANFGELFQVGDLAYHNGSIPDNTGATAVDLTVTLDLTTPAGVFPATFNLHLVNTPNTANPGASADFVSLPPASAPVFEGYQMKLAFGEITGGGFVEMDQFHVLEGNNASAVLMARVTAVPDAGSTLILLGIAGAATGALRRRLSI